MRGIETYQSNAAEAPVMRKWFLAALILSLLFHAGLLLCFQNAKLERFSEGPGEQRLVPLTAFHASRVDIPEKLLESDKTPATPTVTTPTTVKNIEPPPEDKPFEDLRATPVADQPLKQIVPAPEKLDVSNLQSTAQMEQKVSRTINEDIDPAIRNQLIKDNPKISNAPKLRLGDEGSGSVPPGFQSIDQALNASGTKNAKAGPILMPTDLLFDYDKADLRESAVSSLEKLGKLILSNPHAAFTIEGHTDSHGPADYNMTLSLRRADSVKSWLVASMGIDPSRIETKGYGSTKLIVPANDSIELEQINRRVEIVIHQHAARVTKPKTETE